MSRCLLLLALLLFSPQTLLKILMKQFCFLHKLKAFPLSTNNVYQTRLFTNPKRTLNFGIDRLLPNAFRNFISERRRLTRTRFNRRWYATRPQPNLVQLASGLRTNRRRYACRTCFVLGYFWAVLYYNVSCSLIVLQSTWMYHPHEFFFFLISHSPHPQPKPVGPMVDIN